ncbi:MAG: hypothetical protein QXM00_09525 [Candidatus Bathyarchaeia archaeon]
MYKNLITQVSGQIPKGQVTSCHSEAVSVTQVTVKLPSLSIVCFRLHSIGRLPLPILWIVRKRILGLYDWDIAVWRRASL